MEWSVRPLVKAFLVTEALNVLFGFCLIKIINFRCRTFLCRSVWGYKKGSFPVSERWARSRSLWLEAIHSVVGCHYLLPGLRSPSQPIGWYQMLGKKGTCVWAACQRLLPGSGLAEIRTRNLLGGEQTLYRYAIRANRGYEQLSIAQAAT